MLSRYLWSKKKGGTKKDKEITLVVEGESESVRRSALVKHSAVFRKMADDGELKASKEIRLKGVTVTALRKIVEYIREDSVYFQSHHEAIEVLRAAYLYQLPAMNDICSNFLITAIDIDNVCDIFEFSSTYSFTLVEYHCLRFIDLHASEVLQSDSFFDLKKATVVDIIKRHSLDIHSEVAVFKAVMTWSTRDCERRGVNPQQDFQELFKSAKPLLHHVRFATMSDDELSDPEVDRIHKLLVSGDSSTKRMSLLRRNSEAMSRSGTCENAPCWQPREHVPHYEHDLEVLRCDEHTVKNGESFCLRLEVLKGRVFLKGVCLAFDRFVDRKNTSCLYVAITATHQGGAEQRTARGTFMSASDGEALLQFASPLVALESESVELVLQVKRAVNICGVVVRSDVQIAMPDTKEVAMKITPASEKSMFKSIRYFY